MYCDSNMTITNCTISENSAGHLTNTYFARAGGIYCAQYSYLTIDKSTIDLNSAKSGSNAKGGGIYVEYSLLTINNSLITRNEAMSAGGGMYIATSSNFG